MQIPVERQPFWRNRKVLVVAVPIVFGVASMMLLSVVPHTATLASQSSPVTRGELSHQISAFGVLVPQKVQSLIAMTEGRVLQLAQRPGAMLEAGQPIL